MTSHWHGATYWCTTCLKILKCAATGQIHVKKPHNVEGSLAHEDSQELKEYRLKYMIPTELLIVNRSKLVRCKPFTIDNFVKPILANSFNAPAL